MFWNVSELFRTNIKNYLIYKIKNSELVAKDIDWSELYWKIQQFILKI